MKKTFGIYLAMLLPIVYSCTGNRSADEQHEETTIVNPVLPGDHPDPTVIKIGDTYWASATSNEWAPLFPIYKSTDLENWEQVSYAFADLPEWARNNFWAPELAYDEQQGKVYLYYTARDKSTGRLAVAVASAPSPEGPYTDHGPLVSQEFGSIDAYEVKDEDGKIYLMWKEDGNSKGQPTPMWAQEINPERTELKGEMHQLFVNDSEWEGQLVEGISVFKHNDYYYATYSAGGCCEVTCNYKTGVARAKHLLGPWEKYENNPVLIDNDHWKCAGHGTVVKRDGDFYYLYHAYNQAGSVYVGREGVLEKINWTADGWPVFANDATYNRDLASVDYTDDFKTLNPVWRWRVNQPAKYTVGDNGLFLTVSQANDGIGSLLVQPITSIAYEVSAAVVASTTSEQAGASVTMVGGANNRFGAPIAGIGIGVFGKKVKVWRIAKDDVQSLKELDIASTEETVTVKMAVTEGHTVNFSWKEGDAGEWKTALENYDAAPLVPWGMGFRVGVAAQGTGGEQLNITQFEIKNR
ncbi:beta-xylosidase [Parapedobacter pyrenivorans]|uniref:Beta-xylosidase n=1 Tax=Parapedobacter pyrenivorans TaxID=1305674 RepID=A0A917I127_9SPHI|nr:glycoside hydrolase family 43 protein [Parapedobacter pyrenivorans]GGH00608.1 beta-xylosidase [Parapedobacter pyrenivorans]